MTPTREEDVRHAVEMGRTLDRTSARLLLAAIDEARRERDEKTAEAERLREAAELVRQRMKRDGEILCGTRLGSADDILDHMRVSVALDDALRPGSR